MIFLFWVPTTTKFTIIQLSAFPKWRALFSDFKSIVHLPSFVLLLLWLSIRFEKLVKNGKKPKEKGGVLKNKKKFCHDLLLCACTAHSYTAKNLRKRKKILVELAGSAAFYPLCPIKFGLDPSWFHKSPQLQLSKV